MHRNPFPELGTAAAIQIEPVGYEEDLDRILRLIIDNGGNQHLFIGIRGRFGLGKSTILNNFRQKLQDRFAIRELDLSKIVESRQYTLLEQLQEYVRIKDAAKQGIVVLIDEGQKIAKNIDFRAGVVELTHAQERFLEDLRTFSDTPRLRSVTLIVALHPESYDLLFEGSGRVDISQRCRTEFLNLKDLNHYSAHRIIDKFLAKESIAFDDYFDRAVVNCIYSLLPHVEKDEYYAEKNGRTLSQVFFNLFEYAKENGKITKEIIQDILLRRVEIKFGGEPLALKDLQAYERRRKSLSGKERELFEYLVFDPEWKAINDIPEELRDVAEETQLIKRRRAILLSDSQYKIIRENRNVFVEVDETEDIETIYHDGAKYYLIFVDQLSPELKVQILGFEATRPEHTVVRISDDQLFLLYGLRDVAPHAEAVASYLEQEANPQIDLIYNILKSDIPREKTSTGTEKAFRYLYSGDFSLLGKVRLQVMLFYYPEKFRGEYSYKQIVDAATHELSESHADIALILFDQYVEVDESLEQYHIEIKKMSNRLFIKQLTREELGKLLKENDYRIVNVYVKECLRIYMSEAVEEGFIIPLVGFKEKIRNDTNLFIKAFAEQIYRGWMQSVRQHNLWWRESMQTQQIAIGNWFSYEAPERGTETLQDGKLQKLAVDTLRNSRFLVIDENESEVIGGDISIYEQNLLDLFSNSRILSGTDLDDAIAKYFSSYSRFAFVDKGQGLIFKILERKGMMEYDSGKDEYHLISIKEMSERVLEREVYVHDGRYLTEGEKSKLDRAVEIIDKIKLAGAQLNEGNYREQAILNSMLQEVKVDIAPPPKVLEIKEKARKIQDLLNGNIDKLELKLAEAQIENYLSILPSDAQEAERFMEQDPELEIHSSQEVNKDIWWLWCVSSASQLDGGKKPNANKLFRLMFIPHERGFEQNAFARILEMLNAFHDNLGEFRRQVVNRSDELEDILKRQRRWRDYQNITEKVGHLNRFDYYLDELRELDPPSMLDAEKEKQIFASSFRTIKNFLQFYAGYINFLRHQLRLDSLGRIEQLERDGPAGWDREWKGIESYIGWLQSLQPDEKYIMHELQQILKGEGKGTKFHKKDLEDYLDWMGYEYSSEKEKLLEYGKLVEITGTRRWFEYRKDKQPKERNVETTEYELLETPNE